jgi:DNA-binding XRE family transcriptional regulator
MEFRVYMRTAKGIWSHGGSVAVSTAGDPWATYARDLGVNLDRARQAADLSQERMAHAAGMSTFTYRKLEKGESNPGTPANPRLRTLGARAEVLNIATVDLLPRRVPSVAPGTT